MTSTELVGRELDRAIAEAIGDEIREFGGTGTAPYDEGDTYVRRHVGMSWLAIPPFHTSIDALRDGPERILREAGLTQSHTESGSGQQWEWWYPRGNNAATPRRAAMATGGMDEPVRAFAALLALKERVDA